MDDYVEWSCLVIYVAKTKSTPVSEMSVNHTKREITIFIVQTA